jgi:hypothetical protein
VEQSRSEALRTRLREELRQYPHEALHMIGGVDQLVARLLLALQERESGMPLRRRERA